MYGPHINTLSVYAVVGRNYTGQTPFWRRSGTQGNKWIEAQVTLYAGQPFSVWDFFFIFLTVLSASASISVCFLTQFV